MSQEALVIKNLTKYYKNGVHALREVDIEVDSGSFFALIGQNGAGKSTLIGILSHLVLKTSGSVSLYGVDLEKEPSRFKSLLGVVPQEYNLSAFEKLDNILHSQGGYYGLSPKESRFRAQEFLEKMQLWDMRHEITRNLSGGMKRRLMIARALMHNPRFLILDEPTAGIDIEIRKSVWSLLQELNASGTTIILTTHYLEEAEFLCKDMAIIHDGQIMERGKMHESIAKLSRKQYILRLEFPATPQQVPPSDAAYSYDLKDSRTLEVSLSKEASLNELFQALSVRSIHVSSIKAKSNDLEEVFFKTIRNGLSE